MVAEYLPGDLNDVAHRLKCSQSLARGGGSVIVTIRRPKPERATRVSAERDDRGSLTVLPRLDVPSAGTDAGLKTTVPAQTPRRRGGADPSQPQSQGSMPRPARPLPHVAHQLVKGVPSPRPAPPPVRLRLSVSGGGFVAADVGATRPPVGHPPPSAAALGPLSTGLPEAAALLHRGHRPRQMPKCTCGMLPPLVTCVAAADGSPKRAPPTAVHRWPCVLSQGQGLGPAIHAGSRQELENVRFAAKLAKWEAAKLERLAKLRDRLDEEGRTPSPQRHASRSPRMLPSLPSGQPPACRTPRLARAGNPSPSRATERRLERLRAAERDAGRAARAAAERLAEKAAEHAARLQSHDRIRRAIRARALVRARRELACAVRIVQIAWRCAQRRAETARQVRRREAEEAAAAAARCAAAVRIQAAGRGSVQRRTNRPMQLEMTLGCHGVVRGLDRLDRMLSGVTARLAALETMEKGLPAPMPDEEEPLLILHELVAARVAEERAREEADRAEEAVREEARVAEGKERARREEQRLRGQVGMTLRLDGGAVLQLSLRCRPAGFVWLPLQCRVADGAVSVPLTLRLNGSVD